jgi:hypothetical protein
VCICAVVLWQNANRRTAGALLEAKNSFESEAKEAIPVGSDKALVRQFLNSKRMQFVNTVPIPQEEGKSRVDTVSTIEATSIVKISTPLGVCWNSVKFSFDSNDKLIEFVDRPVCKGIL